MTQVLENKKICALFMVKLCHRLQYKVIEIWQQVNENLPILSLDSTRKKLEPWRTL